MATTCLGHSILEEQRQVITLSRALEGCRTHRRERRSWRLVGQASEALIAGSGHGSSGIPNAAISNSLCRFILL